MCRPPVARWSRILSSCCAAGKAQLRELAPEQGRHSLRCTRCGKADQGGGWRDRLTPLLAPPRAQHAAMVRNRQQGNPLRQAVFATCGNPREPMSSDRGSEGRGFEPPRSPRSRRRSSTSRTRLRGSANAIANAMLVVIEALSRLSGCLLGGRIKTFMTS